MNMCDAFVFKGVALVAVAFWKLCWPTPPSFIRKIRYIGCQVDISLRERHLCLFAFEVEIIDVYRYLLHYLGLRLYDRIVVVIVSSLQVSGILSSPTRRAWKCLLCLSGPQYNRLAPIVILKSTFLAGVNVTPDKIVDAPALPAIVALRYIKSFFNFSCGQKDLICRMDSLCGWGKLFILAEMNVAMGDRSANTTLRGPILDWLPSGSTATSDRIE